jgi:hypothetical protein
VTTPSSAALNAFAAEESSWEGLQNSVLQPEAMEYTLAAFELALEEELSKTSGTIEQSRRRINAIDEELARLAQGVALQGPSIALMNAISGREAERASIERTLWGSGPNSIKAAIDDVRHFATEQLNGIRSVICEQTPVARMTISKHVDRIVMQPTWEGDRRFYVAQGGWDLLGKYEGRPGAALRNLEMVAGVRFELTTFGL